MGIDGVMFAGAIADAAAATVCGIFLFREMKEPDGETEFGIIFNKNLLFLENVL